MNEFIEILIKENLVDERGAASLAASNIRSRCELQSLLTGFPTLAKEGILRRDCLASFCESQTLPRLRAAHGSAHSPGARRLLDDSFILRSLNSATLVGTPKLLSLGKVPPTPAGAQYPAGAPARPGYAVPVPAHIAAGRPLSAAVPRRSTRVGMKPSEWEVRDQGMRGTCVAFAMAACCECELGRSARKKPDLSEQFLYWATKTFPGSPDPDDDGTLIEFAGKALKKTGICVEELWPYDRTFRPADITHESDTAPSIEAVKDAKLRRFKTRYFIGRECDPKTGKSGNAAKLRAWLEESKRPVAISLPVFIDREAGLFDNWNTAVGWQYGCVLDPPPTAKSRGGHAGGHAVCVTGFVPDKAETHGGYFIVRNSWSHAWGHLLPAEGYHAAEKGYGQVSASYVEGYLWEMCQIVL